MGFGLQNFVQSYGDGVLGNLFIENILTTNSILSTSGLSISGPIDRTFSISGYNDIILNSNVPMKFNNPTAGTAGAVAGYLDVIINGNAVKIPYHNP